jgi:hypothetical protein
MTWPDHTAAGRGHAVHEHAGHGAGYHDAASLDRGQTGIDAVVRFERRGARVLLVRRNTVHRAVSGDDALQRSVDESFTRSVHRVVRGAE